MDYTKMPKLYIISGCNGSGKTTASYTLLPELLDCWEFVNSDEFAKGLSPFNPSAASVGAGRMMLKKIYYLFEKRADFCIETTLATRSLIKMVYEAKRQGYKVTLLYFWLPSTDMAIKRIEDRVKAGGHFIPEHVVKRRYKMGISYLFDYYIPIVDRWLLADNSQKEYSLIAEGNKTETIVADPEKYRLILDYAKNTKEEMAQQ